MEKQEITKEERKATGIIGSVKEWSGIAAWKDKPAADADDGASVSSDEEAFIKDDDLSTDVGEGPKRPSKKTKEVDFHLHRQGKPLSQHEIDALRGKILPHYKFSDDVQLGERSPSADNLPVYTLAKMKTLAVKVPSQRSLRDLSPEVYDQGDVGCCVGNSTSMAWRITRAAYNSETYFRMYLSGYNEYKPSRAYIYDNAKIVEGTNVRRDEGCTVHGALLATKEHKMASESVWPYSRRNCLQHPSLEAYVEASSHSTPHFEKIANLPLGIKASISRGSPVMFGAVVYAEIKSNHCLNTGDISYPNKRERPIGAHCMLIVGYDDEEGMFEIQNSWGKIWGDGGFGRMPYRYVTDSELCGDFWAFKV